MRFNRQALIVVLISVLTVYTPTEAWYKPAAGPSYYSVGRASGLLSGIRRSPVRRAQLESGESSENDLSELYSQHNSALTDTNVCVKDVTPNLKSCELVRDTRTTLRCEATVLIAMNSRECLHI